MNWNGVYSKKEALFEAPTAPSGTYVQEYYNAAGDLIKFIGTYIPLYITPQLLDWEFTEFIKDAANAHIMAELLSRGGAISNEDKLRALSSTKAGRLRLKEYKNPLNILIRDSEISPILVKDYYIEDNGIAGTGRGPRPNVKDPLKPNAFGTTFAETLAGLLRGGGGGASGSGAPTTAPATTPARFSHI